CVAGGAARRCAKRGGAERLIAVRTRAPVWFTVHTRPTFVHSSVITKPSVRTPVSPHTGVPSKLFEPRDHIPAPDELAGRVRAVTGAGSGIGRAVALACARCQANVVLIGRNTAELDAVHGEIAAAGWPEASIALLDLEKALARDYDALADALLERYGR